jgi:hypothetical protein
MADPIQPEDDFDEQNAKVLIEMLSDPVTSEPVRLQIINEILEQTKDNSFFETMYKENMSQGVCPSCSHENHWLIPEDDLNIFGHVTADEDIRVKKHTEIDDCPKYAEACSKKKTTV